MQLTFDDIYKPSKLSKQIKQLTGIKDDVLINTITKSIEHFQKLPKEQQYCLSFSGGKDSHVLLAMYLLYLKLGNTALKLVIKFADTKLEHHSLYKSIYLAKDYCRSLNIPFQIVYGKQSYWFIQFAIGYPVPTHFARWCTGKLKVQPMQNSKMIKAITGRHLGESLARDRRLQKTCGSDTCGEDLIKDKYDPLIHWRTCQIWDALFYLDGVFLYKNCFNILKSQYEQAQDEKTGSLRLGCFMCPVISIKTIQNNQKSGLIDENAVNVRYLLEDLRSARRIKSERTKKNGAIYIEDRRMYWNRLDKSYLLKHNWILAKDIIAIDRALESNYAYPPTYKKEWIDLQHSYIKQGNGK